MNFGYSILFRETFNAKKLDYRDCEYFQIVCPICKEPVFKVTRDLKSEEIHYLSHYKDESKESNNETCELRVKNFSKEKIQTQNSTSREQKLKFYLSILSEAIKKNEYRDNDPKKITRLFLKLNRSKPLDFLREQAFNYTSSQFKNLRKEEILMFFDDYIQEFEEISGKFPKTSFSLNLQKEIAYDIWKHLLSEKAKDNYFFLFNHSYFFLMSRFERASTIRDLNDWEKVLLRSMDRLIEASNSKSEKIFKHLMEYEISQPYAIEDSKLFSKMISEITHELLGTLVRVPYFKLLKEGYKKSINNS